MGFIATPRTDGRLFNQRDLPAFPKITRLWDIFEIEPNVAVVYKLKRRYSPEFKRKRHENLSLDTIWALQPAARAKPPLRENEILCTKTPNGRSFK